MTGKIKYLRSRQRRGRWFHTYKRAGYEASLGVHGLPPDAPEVAEAYARYHEEYKRQQVRAKELERLAEQERRTGELRRWAATAVTRAKARSRGKRECTITADDVLAMFEAQGGRCAMTGCIFDFQKNDKHYRRPFAPSMDRIDNREGYVPGNVRLVCVVANLARADFGDETFAEMVKGTHFHRSSSVLAEQGAK